MKQKTETAPVLRFPEFTDALRARSLEELSKDGFSNGVFNDPEKVGRGYRLVNVKDMYVGSSIDVEALSLINIDKKLFDRNQVKFGDVFFTRSSLVREGIAYSNVCLNREQDITFDGHLIKMSPNQDFVNPEFLGFALRTSTIRRQLVAGGKTTTMTTIGQEDIAGVRVFLPSIVEQEKIAAFLSAVDEKIGQLARKKEILLKFKKGVMQQIFAQKIRFRDDKGNYFPDWEEKKIGDIFEVTRGKVLAMGEVSKIRTDDSRYPVYSSQTMNQGLAGYFRDYLFENCITWTTDGAGAGDVNFRKGKFYCTNVCGVLKSDIGYANQFTAELLNTKTRKHVSYVGNPKLMNNIMAQIKIRLPKSIREQNLISGVLESIDTRIDLIEKQAAKTKIFKKGLLQQMFV